MDRLARNQDDRRRIVGTLAAIARTSQSRSLSSICKNPGCYACRYPTRKPVTVFYDRVNQILELDRLGFSENLVFRDARGHSQTEMRKSFRVWSTVVQTVLEENAFSGQAGFNRTLADDHQALRSTPIS